MVTIPTTDRQFYDTQAKESGLATYSKALAPAVELFNTVIQEEQKSKIALLKSEASLKLNDVSYQWRMENMTDPNSPEATQDLIAKTDEALSGYREQIDPMYRSLWDTEINKVKHSMDRENMRWRFNTTVSNIGKNYTSMLGNIKIEQNTNGLMPSAFANAQKEKFLSSAISVPGITKEQYTKDSEYLYKDVFNTETQKQFLIRAQNGDLSGMIALMKDYSRTEGFTPNKEIQNNMATQAGKLFNVRFANDPNSVTLEQYKAIKELVPEYQLYTNKDNPKATIDSHYENVEENQKNGVRPKVANVELSEKAIKKYLEDIKNKNKDAFGIMEEGLLTSLGRALKNGISFSSYTPPEVMEDAERRKEYEQAYINDVVSLLHKIGVAKNLNDKQRASLRTLLLEAIENETLRDDYNRMTENLYSLAGSKSAYYENLNDYDKKQQNKGIYPFSKKTESLIANTALALATAFGNTIREEAEIKTTAPLNEQGKQIEDARAVGMDSINNIMDGYVKKLLNGLYGIPMKDLKTLKAGETILRLPVLNGLEVKYMGYGSQIFVKVN